MVMWIKSITCNTTTTTSTVIAIQLVLLFSYCNSLSSIVIVNHPTSYGTRGYCSFQHIQYCSRSCTTRTILFAKQGSRGSSGTGFGSTPKKSSTTSSSTSTKAAVTKKIQKEYGGISAKEIALGTQRKIEERIKKLPLHLQVATQLYQKLQLWDQHISKMSLYQQTNNVPLSDREGAQNAQKQLDQLCNEYTISTIDIHNLFQRITWDASADAKAARSITGTMSPDVTRRIDRACQIVGESVQQSTNTKYSRCLDVGCGYGVLVPNLIQAGGIIQSQIYGVDISPEMIRNANELYLVDRDDDASPSSCCSFIAADFVNEYTGPKHNNNNNNKNNTNNNKNIDEDEDEDDDGKFDSIIFCSSLHNFPDPIQALKKAGSLVRPSGTIVIVHAQGAGHVMKQVESNPVLVKHTLPNSVDLRFVGMDINATLLIEPALPNTPLDVSDGYLAVFQKKNETI